MGVSVVIPHPWNKGGLNLDVLASPSTHFGGLSMRKNNSGLFFPHETIIKIVARKNVEHGWFLGLLGRCIKKQLLLISLVISDEQAISHFLTP